MIIYVHGEPGTLADAGRKTPHLSEKVRTAVKELEGCYLDHPGFKHYFWDFMAKGEYDLNFLQQYALYYYEHVRVFRLYLAGAMTVVPIEGFQVALAEIIADEFGVRLWEEPDVDGHPELFRRFMRSLNLTEADWGRLPKPENLLEGVANYKKVHYSMFRGDMAEEMVGAIIFGMERTTPHRHSSMLEGIRKFEARTGHKVDAQFFSEHVSVDDYHNHALIEPLVDWFYSSVSVARMKRGTIRSFDAREEFLDDLATTLGVPKPNPNFPNVIKRLEWRDTESLKSHEQTQKNLHNELKTRIQRLGGKASIPAITITESGVIIDGHHRWSALRALGHSHILCAVIDYFHESVVVEGKPKSEILENAERKMVFAPKTTKHWIKDFGGKKEPITVITPVVRLGKALPSFILRSETVVSRTEKEEL